MKLAIALVITVVRAGSVFGQAGATAPTTNAQKVASQALTLLRGLDSESTFGFTSTQQVPEITLGAPIAIYDVPLDAIKNFRPTVDVNSLLQPSQKFLYPVKTGPLVVSSLIVQETDKGWAPGILGDVILGQLVTEAITDSAKSNGIDAGLYFVVEILPMNLHFVAHRNANRLLLRTISDDLDLHLKSGVEEPADEIFKTLQPLSLNYGENPS